MKIAGSNPAGGTSNASVYFLKVQLRGDRATRTIAILPDHTLSDLHYAIQQAFGWDADHLYSFYLVPRHQFMYFFDYGDSHEFIVAVLGIETRADDGDYPRVIDSRGKAPRQYHRWDEEEDDEEG